MIYGVTIGTTDTLTEWGLMLLSDITIGSPPLKSVLIDVPGRDGTVNMSYAVSGEPVFNDRSISLTLFKAVDDSILNTIRAELATHCHGKMMRLVLPTDSTHYYMGLFSIGDITGYNSGKIPVSVISEPYAYKNEVTTQSITIPSGGTSTVTLANEERPASVSLMTSGNITIAYNGATYALGTTATALPFKLPAGSTEITITGSQGTTISLSWQEARI